MIVVRKTNYTSRKPFAIIDMNLADSIELTIVIAIAVRHRFFYIRLTFFHLRIICRQLLVKHKNIFVRLQRHSSCIQEAASFGLFPNPCITIHLRIAHYQFRRKHTLPKQGNTTVFFNDSAILFPQCFKIKHLIPLVSGA